MSLKRCREIESLGMFQVGKFSLCLCFSFPERVGKGYGWRRGKKDAESGREGDS